MPIFNAIITPRSEADCNRLASLVQIHGIKSTDTKLDVDNFPNEVSIQKPFKVGQAACFFINQYGRVYSGFAYPETVVNALAEDIMDVNQFNKLLNS